MNADWRPLGVYGECPALRKCRLHGRLRADRQRTPQTLTVTRPHGRRRGYLYRTCALRLALSGLGTPRARSMGRAATALPGIRQWTALGCPPHLPGLSLSPHGGTTAA